MLFRGALAPWESRPQFNTHFFHLSFTFFAIAKNAPKPFRNKDFRGGFCCFSGLFRKAGTNKMRLCTCVLVKWSNHPKKRLSCRYGQISRSFLVFHRITVVLYIIFGIQSMGVCSPVFLQKTTKKLFLVNNVGKLIDKTKKQCYTMRSRGSCGSLLTHDRDAEIVQTCVETVRFCDYRQIIRVRRRRTSYRLYYHYILR